MDPRRLCLLEGVVKPYAWGSPTAIPELLGLEPSGAPQAELWLGAHPGGCARALGPGGESLDLAEWIRREPEALLGSEGVERFGAELPFLLKVLASEQPLSIQAHPDREQARAGFARENEAGLAADAPNRSYRDPHPKPELLCALTRFRALHRFREPAEIRARLAELEIVGLAPWIEALEGRASTEALSDFFGGLLKLGAEARADLVAAATAAATARHGDPLCAELLRLARHHPGDVGVLAPFFLNVVELEPGEAIYLPAGEPHSYLGGLGVELMASSDNVLRGGLTEKFVDVDELLATLRFEPGEGPRLRPQPVGPAEQRYLTPAQEFELSVLELGPGREWRAPEGRGVEILLCTEGRAEASGPGGVLGIARGQALLAPAAAGSYRLRAEGAGARCYRAAPGAAADARR